jgi:hypothetical protein
MATSFSQDFSVLFVLVVVFERTNPHMEELKGNQIASSVQHI